MLAEGSQNEKVYTYTIGIAGLTPVSSCSCEDWCTFEWIQLIDLSQFGQVQRRELVLEESVALADVGCRPGNEDCATIDVVTDDCWSVKHVSFVHDPEI
jgi:hypothetical protein